VLRERVEVKCGIRRPLDEGDQVLVAGPYHPAAEAAAVRMPGCSLTTASISQSSIRPRGS